MKKKLLFIPLFGMLLAGCTVEDLMFWQKKKEPVNEKEPENPGDNKEKEPEPEPSTGSLTKTINFYGSSLPSDWTASGVSLDSTLLSCQKQNAKFIPAIESQVGNTSLLSELFFKKLNTAVSGDGLVIQIGGGNPAKDNFTPGSLVWTSTKKITKVEVTAQCYVKDQGATDSEAHLAIEAGGKGIDVTEDNNYQRPITNAVTADMSFEVESTETPTYKTFTNEYTDGIERFSLTSSGGRVFLKSLTITWNS